MAVCVLLGFIAGWAGTAALHANDPGGRSKMWRHLKSSLLASGIGILVVAWAVRLANLDPLGGATVAAAVGVLGVTVIQIFRVGARNWLRGFLETISDAIKEDAGRDAVRHVQRPEDEKEDKE